MRLYNAIAVTLPVAGFVFHSLILFVNVRRRFGITEIVK